MPHYESIDDRETLCFGQLWYLTEEEREQSLNRYFDSLKTTDWWQTPEAVTGIINTVSNPLTSRIGRQLKSDNLKTWGE